MIEIDGSQGEGGGQILRTSLTLAACLGKAVRVHGIRAGREIGGLRPQHMVAVQAISQICGADMSNVSIGQTELVFRPMTVQPGVHAFQIGTAGSTCLVLQTVAIPLALAGKPSTIELTGGTHNPKAPCLEYLQLIWAPFLARIGIGVALEMPRAGFYPHGGGRIVAQIRPAVQSLLRPVNLTERGEFKALSGVVKIAAEPMNVAYRLVKAATWQMSRHGIQGLDIRTETMEAFDKGGVCYLQADFGNTRAGFFGISTKARSPESAGIDAASAMADFLDEANSGQGAVDPHAADQLMVPLALVPATSRYTTSKITDHCLTNAAVIRQITGRNVVVEGEVGKPGTVTIAE